MPVRVTINLSGVVAGLYHSLQRAIDLVSFGLQAAQDATSPGPQLHGGLSLPGVVLQLTTAPAVALDFETARAEFQRWILKCGMRDCTEALAPLLEEARKVCVVASFGGTMRSEDWNARIVEEAEKFDKRHLPDKLKYLVQLGGPSILPELMRNVESINLARNCLSHRHGIVSARDANSPDGLLVEWVRTDLIASTPSGEQTITGFPILLEQGGIISIRQSAASKLFRFGEPITFTAQEFSELCWTLIMFGQQFVRNLQTLLQSSGIPVTAAEDADTASSDG